MSWKSAFILGLVLLSGPVRADWGFTGVLDEDEPSPAAHDHAFEGKAYHILEQRAGAISNYVQVTRLGNIIVITGEVETAAQVHQVDELILDVAGIKRETNAGAEVVPEKNRECGGKPATGNAKRRLIVTGHRDCSSLRSEQPDQARGRVYNHLSVGAQDSAVKVAAANLLLAEAVMELVNAGYQQVLDRSVMRMAAQDGVLYIIGNPGDVEQTRIDAVLSVLPGVDEVRFYTE